MNARTATRRRTVTLGLAAGLIAGSIAGLSPVAAPAQEARVTAKRLFSSTTTAGGAPIALPQGPVEVVVWHYEIAPGARLPVHKHPYPRYAYVLTGTLDVTAPETGQSWQYRPGDFIVEVVDTWHYGVNSGDEPVRLLVIDQAAPGKPNTLLR